MSEFLLWFLRPIAEFLGSIFLLLAIAVMVGIVLHVIEANIHRAAEQCEEIAKLRKQAEADRRDAERYRWLRHGDNDEWVVMIGAWNDANKLIAYLNDEKEPIVSMLRNEALDAEIDLHLKREAAMHDAGKSQLDEAKFDAMKQRGAKAWKDVPDAGKWVDELRGNEGEVK